MCQEALAELSAGTGGLLVVTGTAGIGKSRLSGTVVDGTEVELSPGDAHVIPPGHDAWVVGDEQRILLDVTPTTAARGVDCPCGVQFRVDGDAPEQVEHLVAAVQQHASGSHGLQASREHILGELQPA